MNKWYLAPLAIYQANNLLDELNEDKINNIKTINIITNMKLVIESLISD